MGAALWLWLTKVHSTLISVVIKLNDSKALEPMGKHSSFILFKFC